MTKEKSILNLHEKKINFKIFNETFEKINYRNPNLPFGNSMKLEDWVKHYEKIKTDYEITKEQIILIFEYLEKFYNKVIERIQPKTEQIYRARNPAEILVMNLNFNEEETIFNILELKEKI